MTAAIAPTVSRHASVLVLCADDYALTEGVSRGIEELACAGRLSATSVMTTTRHWPAHATRIGALRDKLAVGLHFNLTLGTPRGPMPSLAPTGRLPKVGALTARALRGAIDRAEIAAELDRQLDAFETALGHPPDFLDGHQHVHALPGVRSGVLATLARRYPDRRLLLRDPADTPRRIVQRAASVPKALILAALACGFGRAARRAGFPTNDGFAGVSDFALASTRRDFTHGVLAPGRLHLMMCHPGYPDAELATLDPVTDRRRAELDLLMGEAEWTRRVWHPSRSADGLPIDWRQEGLVTT